MSTTYKVILTINDNQPGRARSKARKQLLNTITPDILETGLTDMGFDLVGKQVAEVVRD